MWFPLGIFSKSTFLTISVDFSYHEHCHYDVKSRRQSTGKAANSSRRSGIKLLLWSGRKDERRYRRFSAVCSLRGRLARKLLLKLQSWTTDKMNPRWKQRVWRGWSLQAQRKDQRWQVPFFFGVANKVHVHFKPTSMCSILACLSHGWMLIQKFKRQESIIGQTSLLLISSIVQHGQWKLHL